MSAVQQDKPSFDQPLELLAFLAGDWQGVCQTSFEEGVVTDESPWSGSISLKPSAKFAVHEYSGSLGGKPFSGVMTLAYNVLRSRWELAWTDSFHTQGAIMFATGGAWEAGSNSLTVNCSYPDGQGGPEWGWRTVVALETPNRLSIRQCNSLPDGTPAGGVFTAYDRAGDAHLLHPGAVVG